MKPFFYIALSLLWIAKAIVLPGALMLLIYNHHPNKAEATITLLVKPGSPCVIENNELTIEGSYYDIVSSETKPAGVLYTCLDDREETSYQKTLAADDSSEKNAKSQLEKLKQIEDWELSPRLKSPTTSATIVPIFAAYYHHIISGNAGKVFIPPRVLG